MIRWPQRDEERSSFYALVTDNIYLQMYLFDCWNLEAQISGPKSVNVCVSFKCEIKGKLNIIFQNCSLIITLVPEL